jgi:aminopeptidase N
MRWFSLCLFLLYARPGIDIRKAEMHFIVQPPSRSLRAKITYEFTAQDSILIWDFGRGLELIFWQASFPVQSIQRDTLRQTLTFVAATALSGDRHTLTVQYAGEPCSTGFGSFEVKEHATGYVLWTLSQPYGARDWLFCQDDLSDKVDTLSITVETPPDYLGVGNGRLLADSLTGYGTRVRHFVHHYPIATYLIAIAASNYAVQTYTISTPFHSYTLTNYIFPQDTARARDLTAFILPYFSWIEEKLGPYPFADEGYAQVQMGWRGGMEHQTITFFGSFSLELWAHELAHQWFGDLVTCGSWQDIWLNEAFATLLGGKVYEALPTGLWPRWRYLVILAAWRDTVNTIFVPDTADYRRIFSYPTTYAKGAIALEMLREFLEDEPFWRGLRQYLTDYRYGFARTADFARSVQPHWGTATTQTFLQSWIYQPHFPRVLIQWETPSQFLVNPLRPYPMKVPLHLYFSTESTPQIQNVSLLHPEILTSSAPISHISIDPDTTTLFYKPRYALPPSSPLLLYPNPTSGRLFLLWPRPPYRLSVYDSSGQLQWTQDLTEPVSEIFLSALPAGVYYLLMEAAGETFREKVIKISP